MNLKIGDGRYTIRHDDDLNWQLVETVTIEKGDNAGKEREKGLGYFGCLEDALQAAVRALGDCADADTVNGYIAQLAAIWRDVKREVREQREDGK